ncbi:MAG TPA: hypothetical protein VF212_11655 [Longimicrobiales bacterium]
MREAMSQLARRPLFRTALAATLAAACADAPTEPMALVVAAETEAALQVSRSLPTLPRLVQRLTASGALEPDAAEALASARSLWLDAEAAADPETARALRRDAITRAAPAVARALGPAGLAEVEAGLRRWVELAGAAVGGAELPGVAAALAAGRVRLGAAEAARRDGRLERAAALLLEAADRLRETTPRAVAQRLIHRAEEALAAERRRARPEAAADDVARRRAERLLHGAREALDAGDPVRAIRRAYYARQLLGSH